MCSICSYVQDQHAPHLMFIRLTLFTVISLICWYNSIGVSKIILFFELAVWPLSLLMSFWHCVARIALSRADATSSFSSLIRLASRSLKKKLLLNLAQTFISLSWWLCCVEAEARHWRWTSCNVGSWRLACLLYDEFDETQARWCCLLAAFRLMKSRFQSAPAFDLCSEHSSPVKHDDTSECFHQIVSLNASRLSKRDERIHPETFT